MMTLLFVMLLFLVGLWITPGLHARSAKDVLRDLRELCFDEEVVAEDRSAVLDEGKDAKAAAVSPKRYLPIVIGVIASGSLFLFHSGVPAPQLLATFLLTACLTYLVQNRVRHATGQKERRDTELLLPIVMERMVMAVEAGLDVYASISKITELERELSHGRAKPEVRKNPVIVLLERVVALTEGGVPLEQALKEIGSAEESPALRHAFLHMAVAHREGGELVLPLRELSDATQQYYQETVEEEIAKLPVKATVPLVVSFAGLLIFFITPPILQLSSINPANNVPAEVPQGARHVR